DLSWPHREFHQWRALGPPERPALGHGVSERRAAAAPPEPALRGGARRTAAVRAAHGVDSRWRAQAAGVHPGRVQLRLRGRALDRRTFSRARSPARRPVGWADPGDAAVAAG